MDKKLGHEIDAGVTVVCRGPVLREIPTALQSFVFFSNVRVMKKAFLIVKIGVERPYCHHHYPLWVVVGETTT